MIWFIIGFTLAAIPGIWMFQTYYKFLETSPFEISRLNARIISLEVQLKVRNPNAL
jgi:hypothetical protein